MQMTKSETDTWQNNLVHVYSIQIMLFMCIYIFYRYYRYFRERIRKVTKKKTIVTRARMY